MTLRLRLVLALVGLVLVAQGAFFAATYTLYRRSQFQRLDSQLRSVSPLVDQQLDEVAGVNGPSGPGDRGRGPGRPVFVPPNTFGQLRDAGGTILAELGNGAEEATPKLPSTLPNPDPNGTVFTVPASTGSGSFRILETGGPNGAVTVVGIPTTEATSALDRLVLIEIGALGGLLLVLSAGAWVILRRGLRPLERMAGTARSIRAGDLSQRVSPAGGPSEVGQLGAAINTMLDDIEAAFAEREATERRLRQFLADASHELRTPLTSIQGFAELFRVSGEQARVDLPTILRRIEEESARMKSLVEDLLLLARLDQPPEAIHTAVDLAVLAADACSDAVAQAPDRPVALDAPEPVVVDGDEAHLRQALANLVSNAVRHTPDGTPIEVCAALEGGEGVVTVRDHGNGLDDVALSHVFDRFWQADAARVGTGAGLGLAIVAAIAAEHGGRAGAANAPGGGAVFTLRLPVQMSGHSRPAEIAPPTADPAPAGQPERMRHGRRQP